VSGKEASLRELLRAFLEHSRVKGYSEATVRAREKYLGYFLLWCEDRAITRPALVTLAVLERYSRHLYHYRQKNGRPLETASKYARLSSVRALFKWLARQNMLLYNPASELELPRIGQRLPRHVLTAEEAELLLSLPDLSSPTGVRDRALLETLYATGMRRTEMVRLELEDLDLPRRTALVRLSKGKRDRLIPIGRRAAAWLAKYLADARPALLIDASEKTLFLSHFGQPLDPDHLTRHVKRYVLASGIPKTGSCHLFRHTAATLMLENGADIRFIQQLLGHAQLASTQLYTQVAIRKLAEVLEQTHPAELSASARLLAEGGELGQSAGLAAERPEGEEPGGA
jgi:integrase/recombinase XerD